MSSEYRMRIAGTVPEPGIVTKWMEQLNHPRTQAASEALFLCRLSHRCLCHSKSYEVLSRVKTFQW